ncbi:MAG: anthranilate synthase component I family protein [Ginsengibacter sp.]
MKRQFTTYAITDFGGTKKRMLEWLNQFSIFCFLDNHQYDFLSPSFECLAGAGVISSTDDSHGPPFARLGQLVTAHADWTFGHLSYDLKNEIESLSSVHPDHINFSDLFFFVPEVVLLLNSRELKIGTFSKNHDEIFASIQSSVPYKKTNSLPGITLKSRFSKTEYLETVKQLQNHIHHGDCYEVNFCQEFYAENSEITPSEIYRNLSAISPNPFAAFYKVNEQYLVSGSPERYLKKTGNMIYAQPIKGTAKRGAGANDDDQQKKILYASKKDRAENVMVVDMVRNDLSKICKKNSVKVDELFGIYSFPQVHQMISTISGELETGKTFSDIIGSTFPMGSMTGAPKKRVMEIIEKYERSKRGLFSGSVGYISPEGDFDFNVVIRSIFYNAVTKYISLQAGSAITFSSEPEEEYKECLLKAEAMKKALE